MITSNIRLSLLKCYQLPLGDRNDPLVERVLLRQSDYHQRLEELVYKRRLSFYNYDIISVFKRVIKDIILWTWIYSFNGVLLFARIIGS